MPDVTRFLSAMEAGDPKAAEELLPLVYEELRRLAACKMANEVPGQTLQPTALVHEAWLRLSRQTDARWQNREHFHAVAAEVMRRILVDRARRRQARKHGGQLERVDLDAIELPDSNDDEVVLQVNEALEQLAVEDAEKAEVVKLRFFVGLENAEIAALLGVGPKLIDLNRDGFPDIVCVAFTSDFVTNHFAVNLNRGSKLDPAQGVQVAIHSTTNSPVVLESSIDLRVWTPIATNASSGDWPLLDLRSGARQRFYRTRQP